MSIIRRGIIFFNKVFIKNRPTKPVKMGDNILLLLSAPCTQEFFDREEVRNKFRDYDLAVVNNMIVYSEKEMHEYKPKYIVIFDPGFYTDDQEYSEKRNNFIAALDRVDWDCYLVTTSLAEIPFVNEHVKYLRVSPFIVKKYSILTRGLLRSNWVNFGSNSVIHGALYYAITFGYRNIGILGCTYQNPTIEMKEDGLHILNYAHYYDLDRHELIISNDELRKRKNRFVIEDAKRAVSSFLIFKNLNLYSESRKSVVTNYSKGSRIDFFEYKSV